MSVSRVTSSEDSDPAGSTPADPKSNDNRRASRRRILKSGVLAFNNRHATLPCAVRDLSDSGALLRMNGVTSVPDRFELIVELDGLEADCEVIWRKGRDLGVRFTAPPRKVAPKRAQTVTANVPATPRSLIRR